MSAAVPEPADGGAAPVKKERSVKVMFASVVLTTEAFVVFFATLVAWGLVDLPKVLILVVGLALSAALIGLCAFLTKPWGYAVGWVLQILVIATGFFVPLMFIVGAMFAGTWWYGLRAGTRVDREKRQRALEQAQWERDNPL